MTFMGGGDSFSAYSWFKNLNNFKKACYLKKKKKNLFPEKRFVLKVAFVVWAG